MNCKHVQSWFSDAYDDALHSDIKGQFYNHLESCIDCKKEYDDYSKSLIKVPVLQLIKAPAIESKVMAKILDVTARDMLTEEPLIVHRPAIRFQLPRITFAVLIIVGAFFSGYFLNTLVKPAKEVTRIREIVKHQPASGSLIPVGTNEPCCFIPHKHKILRFESLAGANPDNIFFNNLYVLANPFKLSESTKVYLIAGDQVDDVACGEQNFIHDAAFRNIGVSKAIPLSFVTVKDNFYSDEIASYLASTIEPLDHDVDYRLQTSRLMEYFSYLVKKPRGLVVTVNDNIHSLLVCRDSGCFKGSLGKFINSSYLDSLISKNVEFSWKYKFDQQNLIEAIKHTQLKTDDNGIKSIFGVYYDFIADPKLVAEKISSSEGITQKISRFTEHIDNPMDIAIYIELLRINFHKIMRLEQIKAKRKLTALYSKDKLEMKEIIHSLYMSVSKKQDFKQDEFYSWLNE